MKKITMFILSFALFLINLTIISAQTIIAEGVYQDLNWKIVDKELRIWGDGALSGILQNDDGEFYAASQIPWRQYEFEKVVVEEGITGLEGGFFYCKSLKEAILPASMKSITGTFYGCENLEKVSLKEGVTSFYDAFAYCKKLTSFKIPSTVKSINYSFYKCTSLKEIIIPSNVRSTRRAFLGCTSLEKVVIEEGLENLGERMFLDCTNLKEIHLPSTIQTKSSNTFSNCTSLSFVYYNGTQAEWNQVNQNLNIKDKIVICKKEISQNEYLDLALAEEYFKDGIIEVPLKYAMRDSDVNQETLSFIIDDEKVAQVEGLDIAYQSANCLIGTLKVKPLCAGTTSIHIKTSANEELTKTLKIKDTLALNKFKVEQVDYKTVKLSWSKVAYASYYQVYRFNEKTASWKKMVETTKTSWEDTGYKTGKNYQFCIRAVRLLKDGTKVYSNWSDEVTFATALEGKPYLSATNVGDTAFKLSWSEVKGATRYIIYRKSINDAWKKVLTLGGDVFTYTSASMLPNTYSYRIKAARYDSIDRVMTSPSNIKTLKSVLAAPVIKQLSEQSDGIKVRWEKIESATSYEVYRSTSLEGSYSRVKKTKHLSCVDSTTKANKTYYYKVRALREHQDDVYYSYFSDVVRN